MAVCLGKILDRNLISQFFVPHWVNRFRPVHRNLTADSDDIFPNYPMPKLSQIDLASREGNFNFSYPPEAFL